MTAPPPVSGTVVGVTLATRREHLYRALVEGLLRTDRAEQGHRRAPRGGTRPFWTWQTGEAVSDSLSLDIPADAPPGEYLLLLSVEQTGRVNVFLTDPRGKQSMAISSGTKQVLSHGVELDDDMRARLRTGLREGLSPRHVPDELHQVATIPTTLSGKKLELPVKKILLGADPERVASRGALKDPAALDAIVELATTR